jgi:alpha-methylacyl-CoA racemase
MAGIGPAPFATTMLADLGADVVRIDRPGAAERSSRRDVLRRSRRTIELDLKTGAGRADAAAVVCRADVLIEGFRPGVMERLGLGPDECHAANKGLVYGRITGWGQDGPYSTTAGHDINYIALAGALAHITDARGVPVPPLNLVGDFGGGALYLVVGVLAALLERSVSGLGQVVDAAMVDGTASLMGLFWGFRGTTKVLNALDEDRPASRMLDGGAPYYGVYECADHKYVSLGAIEPGFYAELVRRLGLEGDPLFHPDRQNDQSAWSEQRERLDWLFRGKDRDTWCELLEYSDSCFAPVLTMTEALEHQHNRERAAFVKVGGIVQPRPAPRFSRTVPDDPYESATQASQLGDVLIGWEARQ